MAALTTVLGMIPRLGGRVLRGNGSDDYVQGEYGGQIGAVETALIETALDNFRKLLAGLIGFWFLHQMICHISVYTVQQVFLGFKVMIYEASGYSGLFTNLIDCEGRHATLAQTNNPRLY